jgi:hypothetical protein
MTSSVENVLPAQIGGFARFDNQNGGEIEMGEENNSEMAANHPDLSKNPEIGMSFQALQKRHLDPEEEEEVKTQFSNPLFENPQILFEKRQQKLESSRGKGVKK